MNNEKRMDSFDDYQYETCDICGNRVTLIYTIRDEDWIKIYGDETGSLCIGCLDREAHKKGIKYEFNLYTGFLRWDGIDIFT